MGAVFTASAQFRAVDQMSRTFRKMSKGSQAFAAKTEAAFARMNRKVGKLNKSLGGLGTVMGGALLVGAAKNVIGVFSEFEQANVGLTAVMGTTLAQNKALIDDAKRLGATTAKTATEVVGLQEAFARLGFGEKDILNMTESTIAGSIAMNGELADTAELVGAMVSSFDKFTSADTTSIIDQMTIATQKSALNFEKLQTSLPIVSGAANAAGVPFNKLLALLGKLSDAGIDASSSSTALRNIFIESASQGLSYEQILSKIVKNQDKLTAANDEFGKRAAVSGVILAKNIQQTEELSKALMESGAAQTAADKQLNTLKGSLTILGSAWEGFILSVEDGNGTLGKTLQTIVKVVTEVLSMATGTAKANDQLTKGEKRIRKYAKQATFFLKVIKLVIIAFAALKVAMLANKAVMMAAKFGRVAMIFIKIARAKGIWTAAQWALNLAMSANPIGVIIIAIVALIALVTLIIKKWDTWGAAFSIVLGPFGMLISIIQSFRKNWELVKASFKEGGFLKGIITIGKVILDALLAPIQQLLELIGKIPGLNFANNGAQGIEAFRDRLFEQERALAGQGNQELQTTKATAAQESILREERITKQSASLNINSSPDLNVSVDAPDSFPIQLSTTN